MISSKPAGPLLNPGINTSPKDGHLLSTQKNVEGEVSTDHDHDVQQVFLEAQNEMEKVKKDHLNKIQQDKCKSPVEISEKASSFSTMTKVAFAALCLYVIGGKAFSISNEWTQETDTLREWDVFPYHPNDYKQLPQTQCLQDLSSALNSTANDDSFKNVFNHCNDTNIQMVAISGMSRRIKNRYFQRLIEKETLGGNCSAALEAAEKIEHSCSNSCPKDFFIEKVYYRCDDQTVRQEIIEKWQEDEKSSCIWGDPLFKERLNHLEEPEADVLIGKCALEAAASKAKKIEWMFGVKEIFTSIDCTWAIRC